MKATVYLRVSLLSLSTPQPFADHNSSELSTSRRGSKRKSTGGQAGRPGTKRAATGTATNKNCPPSLFPNTQHFHAATSQNADSRASDVWW
ncbi:hypothetical protein CPB85DRAFT_1301906 [Mucidula mucida]|nr:hypothetical protein CPB85DRAFT_1301906 [Mucidula mucida]